MEKKWFGKILDKAIIVYSYISTFRVRVTDGLKFWTQHIIDTFRTHFPTSSLYIFVPRATCWTSRTDYYTYYMVWNISSITSSPHWLVESCETLYYIMQDINLLLDNDVIVERLLEVSTTKYFSRLLGRCTSKFNNKEKFRI